MGVGLGDSVIAVTTAGSQASAQDRRHFPHRHRRRGPVLGDPAARPSAGDAGAAARRQSRSTSGSPTSRARSRSPQAIERRWGFKSAPWEETYARVLDVFALQDKIMFLHHRGDPGGRRLWHLQRHLDHRDGEGARHRDHALDRHARRAACVAIFLIEGIVVGVAGMILGWLAGWGLGALMHMVPAPTGNAGDRLPVKLTPLCSRPPASSRSSRRSGRHGCRRARPPALIRCRSSAGAA